MELYRSVAAWEYHVVAMWWDSPDTECDLKQLGETGWQLTGIIPMMATPGRAMFYFRRPDGYAHVEYDSTGHNIKGEYGGAEF